MCSPRVAELKFAKQSLKVRLGNHSCCLSWRHPIESSFTTLGEVLFHMLHFHDMHGDTRRNSLIACKPLEISEMSERFPLCSALRPRLLPSFALRDFVRLKSFDRPALWNRLSPCFAGRDEQYAQSSDGILAKAKRAVLPDLPCVGMEMRWLHWLGAFDHVGHL